MQYTVKELPKALKEVKVTLTPAEIMPYLEKAAGILSSKIKVEGFRPGKASYEIMKGRFGEMAILEEALPEIVQHFSVEAITKEKIETVGEPSVNVEKAAPGNDVIFAVTVAVLPRISKMPELKDIKVKAKEVTVTDAEVEKVVDELRKMQALERDVDRAVGPKDKVTVDMVMTKGGVSVEGGTSRDHAIYLDEAYYVPGLNEQIIGMKVGENKRFMLPFPKEHYNKTLAGHDVDFDITVKKVQEIVHPEASDAFAQALGKKDLAELRDLLRTNIQNEGLLKEQQRQELAVIEELLAGSKFDELPEMLINAESRKMLHELEHSIERNQVTFDDYLMQIKKTRNQLLLDFTPEAVKRVKASIMIREIARKDAIEPSDAEMLDEQFKLLEMYKDDGATQDQIRSEDGEAYIRTTLRNRKVMEHLRKNCVK